MGYTRMHTHTSLVMFTLGGKLWAASDGAFGCVPRTQAYCLWGTSLPPNSKPKDNKQATAGRAAS